MRRNCTAQMNRAVEILKILRNGMESMVGNTESLAVRYTRIFNFDEQRVSLRMETLQDDGTPVAMGRIDVFEIPTNNGRVTCNCLLTELGGGKSERVTLRLKSQEQREKECEKVFGFFRKILAIPEVKPLDGGFSGLSRGAHHQAPKPSE